MRKKDVTAVRTLYNVTFTDEVLLQTVLAVVDDIVSQKYPDDSPMGFYTVGDVRNISGFYADEAMLRELTDSLIGRCYQSICIKLLGKIPTLSTAMVDLLQETNDQRDRVTPRAVAACIVKYGTPTSIDRAKIDDLCSRAPNFMMASCHAIQ